MREQNMSSMFDMSDHPDAPGVLSLGAQAIMSGKVSPAEVSAAQQALETPEGQAKVQALVASKLGGNPQKKTSKSSTDDTKMSQTKNIYDPEQFNMNAQSVESLPGIAEQRQGISDMQEMLNMRMDNQPKSDYGFIGRNLAALADAQTGSHLSQSLPPLETQGMRNKENMSTMDELQKRKGDLNKMIFEGITKMKSGSETNSQSQRMMDMMQQGMLGGAYGQMATIRSNNLKRQIGLDYDKDPVLIAITKTNNSLDRAKDMLTGKAPLSAQNFNAAMMDYIQALTQAGSATEGKVSREMPQNLALAVNKIKNYLSSGQDIRKDPEGMKLVRQTLQLIEQVKNNYAQQGEERADKKKSTYETMDPEFAQVSDNKRASWINQMKGQQSAPPAAAPAVGTIDGDHKFKGGDPADQKNWEAVGG